MRKLIAPTTHRRGITVLGLLLLIIALVVAAVFLIRYLRSRPVAAFLPQPAATLADYRISRLIS